MARRTAVLAVLSMLAIASSASAQTSDSDAASLARMSKYFSNVPIGGPVSSVTPQTAKPNMAQRLSIPNTKLTQRMSYKTPVADDTAEVKPLPPLPASAPSTGATRVPAQIEGDLSPPTTKTPAELKPMPLPAGEAGNLLTPPDVPAEAPAAKPAAGGTTGETVKMLPAEKKTLPAEKPAEILQTPAKKLSAGEKPAAKLPTAKPAAPTATGIKTPSPYDTAPKASDLPAMPAMPAVPPPPDPGYGDVQTPPKKPVATPSPLVPADQGTWEFPQDGVLAEEFPCCDPGVIGQWLGGVTSGHLPLGIEARGWLDQGLTLNAFSPRNRSNFPVVFNDRSNDYQLNQFYVILENGIDPKERRIQLGGRVDLLYGTDHVFTTALGLETFRDGSPKWNSDNGPVGTNYGLAMPQAYLEAFAPIGCGLTVKMGHFYTIMGYEVVPAPDNFFYSHAYTFQYGEPITHTGLLAEYTVDAHWKVQAGFTRGWDTWEDNNNGLGFLGGLVWTSDSKNTSVAFSLHTGPEPTALSPGDDFRTAYSLVFQQKINDRLTYVLQHDLGYQPEATRYGAARWYGINQYLIYKINPIWAAGLRIEWFHDKNGFRLGTSDGGDYYELTAGLNWTPRERLTVRPEIRWDWAKTSVNPYADGTLDHQFLLGVDAIVAF